MNFEKHRTLALSCLVASSLSLSLLTLLTACGGEDTGTEAPNSTPETPSDYARLPQKINAFGAAILDDHLYVHGGHTGKGHDSAIEYFFADFRRLDLADPEASWKNVDSPGVPIQQSSLFVYDGKLYRLGGLTAKNHKDEPKDLYTLSDFAVYDAIADRWNELPSMPGTRSSHDVVVADGTLYVTGGWKLEGAPETAEYSSTWLSIDLTTPDAAWETHEQSFQIRDHCGGTADGKVYVLGGMLSGSFPVETHVFDPATDTWSTGPSIPEEATINGFGCATVSLNGTIYYTAAAGIVYRLNTARDGWEEVARLEVPRALHRLVARSESELLAVGGGAGPNIDPIDSIESILLP